MKLSFALFLIALIGTAAANAQDPEPTVQETAANPQVTIHTNRGGIRLELYPDKAPVTVENFLQYARDGHYEGTIFHRIISHFMIQGGGMTADLVPKPTRDPIVNEADNGLKNTRGTIAMARTNEVDSATSQFYINVELNVSLDHVSKEGSRNWGYTVFGRVIDGMDVVDDIRFVPTDMRDVPTETVLIESVEIH